MEIIEEDVVQEAFGTDFKNRKRAKLTSGAKSQLGSGQKSQSDFDENPPLLALRCASGVFGQGGLPHLQLKYFDPLINADPPSASDPPSALIEPTSACLLDEALKNLESPTL